MVLIREASSATCFGGRPRGGRPGLARRRRRPARRPGNRRVRGSSAPSRCTRADTTPARRRGRPVHAAARCPDAAAPRDKVARRPGRTPGHRRAADQRVGPEGLETGAGRRRTAGPWGHRTPSVHRRGNEQGAGWWRKRREASLATAYDLLMFDLDGVVYVDGHAVEHAAESIAHAREVGAHIAFITNNPRGPPTRWRPTCAISASPRARRTS